MEDKVKLFLQIWGVILFLNQVLIFGACFRLSCIFAALPHTGIISFIIFYFSSRNIFLDKEKASKEDTKSYVPKQEPFKEKVSKEKTKSYAPKQDNFKEKGDMYEKHIGSKFEKKGDLVIYNGFIKGYEDKGVDIVSISHDKKEINLIQCKNWTKKRMSVEDVKEVYRKLNDYDLDCCYIDIVEIKKYLKKDTNSNVESQFLHVQQHKHDYTIRKTLYASSDKVMDFKYRKFFNYDKSKYF